MSNYAIRMARLRENRKTEEEPDDTCGEEQNGCVYCFCHPRPRTRESLYVHGS